MFGVAETQHRRIFPAGKWIAKCLADLKPAHPAWQDKQFGSCASAISRIFKLFQFRSPFLGLPKQYETASQFVMNSTPRFDVAGANENKCARGQCPRLRINSATAACWRSRHSEDIPIGQNCRSGNYPNPPGSPANRRAWAAIPFRGTSAFAPLRARCSPGCSRS